MTEPYYTDDHVTIYHGDALEVMAQLECVEAAAVIADPPYYRVVDADWDDQWGADPNDFYAWIGKVCDAVNRHTIDRATIALFCDADHACAVELEIRRRFAFLNHIVWRKPGLGRLGKFQKDTMRRFFVTTERIILAEKLRNPDGDLFRFRTNVNHAVTAEIYADLIEQMKSWRDQAEMTNRDVDTLLGTAGMAGHYFSPSQWTLPTREAYETIRNHTGGERSPFPPYDNIRRQFDSRRQEFDSRRREFDSERHNNNLELLSDCWTFATPLGDRLHPTQKPEPLIRHLMQTTTRPDDLILDPFLGSGTTLRAAKDLGRKAIGIEIDERYCEIAARRMAQEVLPL